MDLNIVEQRPVRVGVVGCGVVADYGHIPAIDRCERAELVGFADPNQERREKQAERYGKPGFESFEQMVEAVELDAVTIATQPNIKLDMIRIAAEHGLHAFCEKPLTDDVEQAEELVRMMDDAGLFCAVAFVYRGQEVVQRMMQLVRDGAIGPLRVVRTVNLWDYHGLRDQAIRGDRRRRALRNLGTLDCGVHHYDLVRYMSGADYEEVNSVGTIVEAENIYPDHIMTNGRMTNDVIVSLEESAVWGYTAEERPRYQHSYTMIGENGLVHGSSTGIAHGQSELYVVSGGEQCTEMLDSSKAWDETYRQFYATITGDPPAHAFVADAHDALINMRVAREVISQCQEGMQG